MAFICTLLVHSQRCDQSLPEARGAGAGGDGRGGARPGHPVDPRCAQLRGGARHRHAHAPHRAHWSRGRTRLGVHARVSCVCARARVRHTPRAQPRGRLPASASRTLRTRATGAHAECMYLISMHQRVLQYSRDKRSIWL